MQSSIRSSFQISAFPRIASASSPAQSSARCRWQSTRALKATSSYSNSKRQEGRSNGESADLVGPNDPLSNLRPVIYSSSSISSSSSPSNNTSPSASASSPSSTSSKSNPTPYSASSPYSNSEFSSSLSSSPSSSSSSPAVENSNDISNPAPHSSLSSSFSSSSSATHTRSRSDSQKIAQDRYLGSELDYRLRMIRIDAHNHDHWARVNLLFNTHLQTRLSELPPPSSASSWEDVNNLTPEELMKKEEVLSRFYADWVNAMSERQTKWVWGWWRDVKKSILAGWRRDWRRMMRR